MEELEVARQYQQPPMATGQTKVVVGGKSIAADKALKAEQAALTKNDIWQADEIPSEDAILSLTDDRPCPRFEFSYKQMVGTQDSFLGLNGRTPGSMDCSHLVVKVHFPGCTMRDLDLDVTRDRIKAASPGACVGLSATRCCVFYPPYPYSLDLVRVEAVHLPAASRAARRGQGRLRQEDRGAYRHAAYHQ